jgi:hypothetical protein
MDEEDPIKQISTYFHSAYVTEKGKTFICGRADNYTLGLYEFNSGYLNKFSPVPALMDIVITQIACG